MRILLANSSAYPRIGGVENSLRFIGRTLLDAGHQARVFCLQLSPDEPLRTTDGAVEIVRYPCVLSRLPHAQVMNRVEAARQGIASALAEYQPHAIWCRSAAVGLGIRRGGYAGTLLQIFSTNARMHCRGLLQTRGLPLLRRIQLASLWPLAIYTFRRIERELLSKCLPVVFSRNMQVQLARAYPHNLSHCDVIPPGVDTTFYSPEHGTQYFKEISQQYAVAARDKIVLYVGRLSAPKNIPLLLEAFAQVRFSARLVLVGEGPEHQRLASYARRIGIGERTVFAGRHHNMLPGFYAMSSVTVLPTTTESFGQVLLESLACGTPVIGFTGDGRRILTATDEIVTQGRTGFSVSTVSPTALAEAISSLLSLDSADRAAMRENTRRDACARFSWHRFVSQAVQLSHRGE